MLQRLAHDALAMIDYSATRSILVLADSAAGHAAAARAITALGYRLSDAAGLDAAPARIDRQIAAAGVMIDIAENAPPDFDGLLDRIEAAAASGRFGSVICAPPNLIDWIAARAAHARIEHLCDPSDAERTVALARAASPPSERLHDVRRETGRLQQLSEEVGRIASILATLSESDEPRPARAIPAKPPAARIDPALVRSMIRARRLRDQYFRAVLFADPAWDMMLDLMAARLERNRVAVSSLCIAAAVPATTALRWIKTLTDAGLVVRRADPQDGRRVYIELSDAAAEGLSAYLRAAQRISPLVV